jgi:hypothetical protein
VIPRLESAPQKIEDVPVTICAYHWRRVGVEVKASRVVLREGFCRKCFSGGSIGPRKAEERRAAKIARDVSRQRRQWAANRDGILLARRLARAARRALRVGKFGVTAAPARRDAGPLRKRASGRPLRGVGGLNALCSGGNLSRKRFCLVGPRWSLEDLERLTCDDRSHCHLSRAGVYDLEKHRAIAWIAVRVGNTFVPNDRPTIDEKHEGGIIRICKIFALRGTSQGLGEYLAAAVRQREDWALAMLAQIRGKRFSERDALPM